MGRFFLLLKTHTSRLTTFIFFQLIIPSTHPINSNTPKIMPHLKKIISSLIVFITSLSSLWALHNDQAPDAAMASRPDAFQNWYIQGKGGWAFLQNLRSKSPTPPNDTIRFKEGFGGAFSVGRMIPSHKQLRFEGEVSYYYFNSKTLLREGYPKYTSKGNCGLLSFFANAYYDFPLWNNDFTFSLGAGIGGSIAMISNIRTQEQGLLYQKSQSGVFAGQGMANFGYEFAQGWIVFLGYHVIATDKPKFKGSPDDVSRIRFDYIITHIAELGLRIKL